MKKVVIIGGGGNGLVVAQIVLDLIKTGESIELVGFLNDNIPVGEYIERWPVLGAPHEWESLDGDVSFVYALLSVGKMKVRAEKFKQLNIPQNRMSTVVHPSASIGFIFLFLHTLDRPLLTRRIIMIFIIVAIS